MRRIIALLLTVAIVWGAYPAAAQDGEGEPDLPTIAAVLDESAHSETSPEFTLLLEAAEEAGLIELLAHNGPFTVFAPTDAAFEATLEELGVELAELAEDYETLLSILTYHLVIGEFQAAELVALGEARLATAYPGSSVDVSVDENGGVAVDGIRVIGTDILAENGVIHIIEGVLVPDADEGSFETFLAEVPEENLAEVVIVATEGNATEDRQFEILLQLVQAADLTDVLAEGGPFTIFAPTDAAFNTFLADNNLTLDALLADPEMLVTVLTYHIVPYPLQAGDVIALDNASVATVNGALLNITLQDGAVVVGGAMVNADYLNILARNGVIHGIDSVLVPAAE